MKPVYITGLSMVSAHDTFEANGWFDRLSDAKSGRLSFRTPDVTSWLSPNQVRRMTNLTKASSGAALRTLENASVPKPDVIITATSNGNLSDMEKFIKEMDAYQEQMLNPLPFIQSTYNNINGLVSQLTGSKGHNFTYVHKGGAFEHALLDAFMHLWEHADFKALCGAFDEITDENINIYRHIGEARLEEIGPEDALTNPGKGAIMGDGSAFFLLENTGNVGSAYIADVRLHSRLSPDEVHNALDAFLDENNTTLDQIDVLVTGKNGDLESDQYYTPVTHPVSFEFKRYFGENGIATAFGLWSAATILNSGYIPGQPAGKNIKTILLYNHYFGSHHSFILLKK